MAGETQRGQFDINFGLELSRLTYRVQSLGTLASRVNDTQTHLRALESLDEAVGAIAEIVAGMAIDQHTEASTGTVDIQR